MIRLSFSVLLAAVAVARPALAAPPPADEGTQLPAAALAAVNEHVARGDKARDAKRWADAMAAYQDALREARRVNMTQEEMAGIVLELGLCELAAASYNDAAEHLYHALVYGAELTARQHERRKEAWARVRPHVATLIVAVNPSDAEITIDGRSIGAGRTSHILFLPPGDHRIRAHLPDYADAEQSTTIPRGEIAKVSLRLSQRFPPPPPPPLVVPAESPGPKVSADAPAPEAQRRAALQLGLGATPILAFGAEPGAGTGGSLDFTVRSGDFSGGLEGRLSGAQVIDGDAAVRTWRAGLSLSLCGHMAPFYLCGVGGMARLWAMKDPRIKRIEEQDPSSGLIGLRPGVEWHIGERFALRAYGELTATLGRPSVWLDGDQYWAAPPVSALVGVGFFIPWRLGREAPRASAARGLVLQGM